MGLVLFVLVWIASTIYLALALALCVLVLLTVYWVGGKLVEQFSQEPPERRSRDTGSRRRPR